MITIEQLLESVDLDFEPRFVTKDMMGRVLIWEKEPTQTNVYWTCGATGKFTIYEQLKLAEFANKHWTECIYEIKKKEKPVAKIEKLNLLHDSALLWGKKINELVAAVNELKGAKNE